MMNRLATAASLALALPLLLSCEDRPTLPADPAPAPPAFATLQCEVSVAAGTLRCDPAVPAAGDARGDLIIGGQGVYVRLANDTPTVADGVMSLPVTVQNLTVQPMGTPDGTTASPRGVRVFFVDEPTNGVEVANPDGYEMYTAAHQPYFQYAGLLRPGRTSQPKTWQFTLNGAESFRFRVLLAAQIPRENGILRVTRVAGEISQYTFRSTWSSPDGQIVVVASTDGAVLRSTDGARTFAQVLNMPGLRAWTLRGSGNTLMIVGPGVFMRSGDAGATWTPRSCSICDDRLLEFAFVGEIVLAKVLEPDPDSDSSVYRLLTSPDGGATWPVQEPSTASFRVWSTGTRWAFSRGGTAMLYTTGSQPHPRYSWEYGCRFICDPLVDVAGWGGVLVGIANAGTGAWVGSRLVRDPPPGFDFTRRMTSVAVVGDTVVAVGPRGPIMRSTIWGIWAPLEISNSVPLWDVSAGGSTFVAVGERGTILRSADAGRTWRNPYGAHFAVTRATDALVVVGYGGIVLRSTDGGMTWTLVPSGTAHELHGVWSSGNTVVAVGRGGTILRSVDAGQTWAPVASGTQEDLYSVAGDGANVVAVGTAGMVVRSTDTGATWSFVSAVGRTLNSVSMSGGTAVAVGERGALRRSADGGATWSSTSLGYEEAFHGVWTDGSLAVAVGARGMILRSTDGGVTWPGAGELIDFVDFRSVTGAGGVLLMTASSGALFQSFDGGVTWTILATGSPTPELNAVWMSDEANFIAVGATGIILRGSR